MPDIEIELYDAGALGKRTPKTRVRRLGASETSDAWEFEPCTPEGHESKAGRIRSGNKRKLDDRQPGEIVDRIRSSGRARAAFRETFGLIRRPVLLADAHGRRPGQSLLPRPEPVSADMVMHSRRLAGSDRRAPLGEYSFASGDEWACSPATDFCPAARARGWSPKTFLLFGDIREPGRFHRRGRQADEPRNGEDPTDCGCTPCSSRKCAKVFRSVPGTADPR